MDKIGKFNKKEDENCAICHFAVCIRNLRLTFTHLFDIILCVKKALKRKSTRLTHYREKMAGENLYVAAPEGPLEL